MRTGGSGLGTVLTGAPLEPIKAGKVYYGKASILGTPYVSGYDQGRIGCDYRRLFRRLHKG